jgi:hypothetical protein
MKLELYRKSSLIAFLLTTLIPLISIASDKWAVPDEVVKQILQHPKLSIFLHPEVKGRVPVVIQSNFVNPKLESILFGKPVVVVPDSKNQLVTNIYFSFFKNGEVSISYPVEGVKGIFKFVLDNKGYWKLKFASVWEE